MVKYKMKTFIFIRKLFQELQSKPKKKKPVSMAQFGTIAQQQNKIHDGSKFKTTGGAEVSTTPITGLTSQRFW